MSSLLKRFEQKDASPTAYEKAVNILREISERGFEPGTNTIKCDYESKADLTALKLVYYAAILIDPNAEAEINEGEGYFSIQFTDAREKPPVRSMWAKLDALRDHLLYKCMTKQNKGENYVVHWPENNDVEKFPFDPINFTKNFIGTNETFDYLYNLPIAPGIKIPHGDDVLTSETLVRQSFMRDFLQAYQPNNTIEDYPPIAISIGPKTVTRMMEELSLSPTINRPFS